MPLVVAVLLLLYGLPVWSAEDPDNSLRQAQAAVNEGRYAIAVQRSSAAAQLYRGSGNQAGLVRALTTLGLAQMYSADYSHALKTFEDTAGLSKAIGDTEYEISSYNNIGTVHYFLGRYSEALEAYRRAQELVDSAPAAPWLGSRRQLTLANTAILYQTLGQFNSALALFNQILNSSQALPAREQAQVLANMGVLRRRLGDPQKALDTYHAAQALYRQSGHRDGEIAVLNDIGILQATDLQDFGAAAATFSTALHLAEQSGDRILITQARLYRGEAHFHDEKLTESAADFNAAAAAASSIGAHEEEWKAYFGLARVALREGRRADGLDLLRKSVERIESLRADIAGPALRTTFLADKRDVYDLLIENTTTVDEAFRYIEQSRARVLADRLGLTHPSLQEMLRILPDDTAVVEYWIGGSSLLTIWAWHGQAGVKRSLLSPQDRELIAGLPSILSDASRADWMEAVEPVARKLLDGIPPLEDPRTTSLIVVPDGALAAIPFEALPHSRRPLIERFNVSYLPASSLLRRGSSPRTVRWFWDPSLKAFADPAPSAGQKPEPVNAGERSRLPGAQLEVRKIAASLGGRSFIYSGSSATKPRVLQDLRTPVLHLATHAFADLENPDLSYILFASTSTVQRYDYLFLKEVDELPLKGVRLVTLSACETGRGREVRGEGVQSFATSFLAAGVPSVVTSLWVVPDQRTAQLMMRFYSRLARGEPVAGAMRGAKLEFVHSATAAHPANWAAFVVDGNASARLPYVIGIGWLMTPILLALGIYAGLKIRAGRASRPLAVHRR
ncbi:MAG TPA: CHAT domain-containing tetratricopeptide repeat protein [Bryobacteraceae bacterium]